MLVNSTIKIKDVRITVDSIFNLGSNSLVIFNGFKMKLSELEEYDAVLYKAFICEVNNRKISVRLKQYK